MVKVRMCTYQIPLPFLSDETRAVGVLDDRERQRRRVVHHGEVIVAGNEHVQSDDEDRDGRHQEDLGGERAHDAAVEQGPEVLRLQYIQDLEYLTKTSVVQMYFCCRYLHIIARHQQYALE